MCGVTELIFVLTPTTEEKVHGCNACVTTLTLKLTFEITLKNKPTPSSFQICRLFCFLRFLFVGIMRFQATEKHPAVRS